MQKSTSPASVAGWFLSTASPGLPLPTFISILRTRPRTPNTTICRLHHPFPRKPQRTLEGLILTARKRRRELLLQVLKARRAVIVESNELMAFADENGLSLADPWPDVLPPVSTYVTRRTALRGCSVVLRIMSSAKPKDGSVKEVLVFDVEKHRALGNSPKWALGEHTSDTLQVLCEQLPSEPQEAVRAICAALNLLSFAVVVDQLPSVAPPAYLAIVRFDVTCTIDAVGPKGVNARGLLCTDQTFTSTEDITTSFDLPIAVLPPVILNTRVAPTARYARGFCFVNPFESVRVNIPPRPLRADGAPSHCTGLVAVERASYVFSDHRVFVRVIESDDPNDGLCLWLEPSVLTCIDDSVLRVRRHALATSACELPKVAPLMLTERDQPYSLFPHPSQIPLARDRTR